MISTVNWFSDHLGQDWLSSLVVNVPTAAAVIGVVILFLRDRKEERQEFMAALRKVGDDVKESYIRVEHAMEKVIEAKRVESEALLRLTERLQSAK